MDIKWLLSFQMTGRFTGAIYIILVILSIISWALIIQKAALLRRVRRANYFFYHRHKKEDFGLPLSILKLSSLYHIAKTARDFKATEEQDREKLEEAVKVNLNEYFSQLNSSMPILATIVSIAPFLGLLGTVWGIMLIFSKLHSEIAGVSEMIAPGVAQALITTIGGLLVAIPALFFYNYFTMWIHRLAEEAENYASRTIYLKED